MSFSMSSSMSCSMSSNMSFSMSSNMSFSMSFSTSLCMSLSLRFKLSFGVSLCISLGVNEFQCEFQRDFPQLFSLPMLHVLVSCIKRRYRRYVLIFLCPEKNKLLAEAINCYSLEHHIQGFLGSVIIDLFHGTGNQCQESAAAHRNKHRKHTHIENKLFKITS